MYAFWKLTELKEITEAWIKEYNEERPHQALNSMTPVQYRLGLQGLLSLAENSFSIM